MKMEFNSYIIQQTPSNSFHIFYDTDMGMVKEKDLHN